MWGKGTWTPAFSIGDSQFHNSWDWLMPVVHKIQYEHYKEFKHFQFMGTDTSSEIEAMCKAVQEYIIKIKKENNE